MSVTKQEFQEQRTAAIQKRYSELRKLKTKRDAALKTMTTEFELSASSLSSIISRSSYQKPMPRVKHI